MKVTESMGAVLEVPGVIPFRVIIVPYPFDLILRLMLMYLGCEDATASSTSYSSWPLL